jgi:dihydrofolate reductase
MRISLVVAMDRQQAIGRDGGLPWHLPADLRHFKAITLGKPIIMGRRTHESIGRPLPGRANIVVSRLPDFQAQGCEVVGCLDEALSAASQARECMVIGGAGLYRHALPIAERIYLTRVHADVVGDVYFPELAWDQWNLLDSTDRPADAANPYDLSFMTFQRQS